MTWKKSFCIKSQVFFHGPAVVRCISVEEAEVLLVQFVFTTNCSKEMCFEKTQQFYL